MLERPPTSRANTNNSSIKHITIFCSVDFSPINIVTHALCLFHVPLVKSFFKTCSRFYCSLLCSVFVNLYDLSNISQGEQWDHWCGSWLNKTQIQQIEININNTYNSVITLVMLFRYNFLDNSRTAKDVNSHSKRKATPVPWKTNPKNMTQILR